MVGLDVLDVGGVELEALEIMEGELEVSGLGPTSMRNPAEYSCGTKLADELYVAPGGINRKANSVVLCNAA